MADRIHEQVEMVRVCADTRAKMRMWRMSAFTHFLSAYPENAFGYCTATYTLYLGPYLGLATVYVMV